MLISVLSLVQYIEHINKFYPIKNIKESKCLHILLMAYIYYNLENL